MPYQLTEKIYRSVPDYLLPEREVNAQTGKIMAVTGGGTGIGAAIARVWVRAGATGVVITGRRQEKLDQTALELSNLNKHATKILAISADVVSESSMTKLFHQVNEAFGRPADVVCANAGLTSESKLLGEEDVDKWWEVFMVKVLGLHNIITAWILSQPRSKNPEGTIINVNSGLTGSTLLGKSAYSTSKLAAHKYIEFLGTEYPSIRSFVLLPGVVQSDMNNVSSMSPFAKDDAELTGVVGLYLVSTRGDYL